MSDKELIAVLRGLLQEIITRPKIAHSPIFRTMSVHVGLLAYARDVLDRTTEYDATEPWDWVKMTDEKRIAELLGEDE